jgi:probable F420-dependent oxidoreductase
VSTTDRSRRVHEPLTDIGVVLPQLGHAAGPEAIRRAAVQAEELGFSHVWVNDHITFPVRQSHPAKWMYDPLLTLATAAAVTREVQLGGQVTAAYYPPLWLANALASLDALAGGRLTVAIGVGWSAEEFAALGSDFTDRGRRTDEIVGILRTAWLGRPFRHSGEHYDFPEVEILPPPTHPIPIWIAGETEPAYRRAVALGDGFHAGSWVLPPDAMAGAVARIRRVRPEPEFVFSVYTHDWDPLKAGTDAVLAEYRAYAEAGVQCVIAAPDQKTSDAWLRSVEQLATALGLTPR